MYCWESPFKLIIEKIRSKEITYQFFLYCISSFNTVMVIVSPTLMLLVSITFFVFFVHSPLSPKFIVIAMSFYMKLNGSLGFFFIKQIQFLITANVSLRRIQVMLSIKILIFSISVIIIIYRFQSFLMEDDVVKTNQYLPSPNPSIKLRNVWSSWTDVIISLLNISTYNFITQSINCRI